MHTRTLKPLKRWLRLPFARFSLAHSSQDFLYASTKTPYISRHVALKTSRRFRRQNILEISHHCLICRPSMPTSYQYKTYPKYKLLRYAVILFKSGVQIAVYVPKKNFGNAIVILRDTKSTSYTFTRHNITITTRDYLVLY